MLLLSFRSLGIEDVVFVLVLCQYAFVVLFQIILDKNNKIAPTHNGVGSIAVSLQVDLLSDGVVSIKLVIKYECNRN